MRSAPSRRRIITKWPAWADLATSGASTSQRKVVGEKAWWRTILYMGFRSSFGGEGAPGGLSGGTTLVPADRVPVKGNPPGRSCQKGRKRRGFAPRQALT